LAGGDHACFAIRADPIVKAEDALRGFVQALTKTFAHLPIGLAVFDRKRALAMFNPALSDLTGLNPESLAVRPTLNGFLNMLRDNHVMPEPKDYPQWRQQMENMIARAEAGHYNENWSLPEGRTFQVTGRPHPDGAVALLIEDISTEITLKRQFRSEIELLQSVIDRLPQAIVVFSLGGQLSYSNSAYKKMWSGDELPDIQGYSITDATRGWQKRCAPAPVFGDIRDFVLHGRQRHEWHECIALLDGQSVDCVFAALPGGGTICSFEFRLNLAKTNHSHLAAIH
jgi:PAS domain-containing protein